MVYQDSGTTENPLAGWFERTCQACHGAGKVIEKPCKVCAGAGRVRKEGIGPGLAGMEAGACHRPPDLRAYLQGRWRVRRVFHDRRRALAGRFAGTADFLECGDELLQQERGRMRFGDYDDIGTRAYRWQFPQPARAELRFADGRPFHALDLSNGVCDVRHDCAADVYCGRFVAVSADEWHVSWRITGPRKDLLIRSRYHRSSVAEPFALLRHHTTAR